MMSAKFQLRVFIAGLLAAAVAAGLVQCTTSRWEPHRFRLTLTVSINGELMSGSSVIEVRYFKGRVGGQMTRSDQVVGTAPIVDLGSYGWLLVPLWPVINGLDWSDALPGRPANGERTPYLEEIPKIINKNGPLRDITKADLVALRAEGSFPKGIAFPELVWIPPVVSKSTPILPLLPDELSSWIGGFARLVSLTTEATDDAVVTKVADPPDWLRAIKDGRIPQKGNSERPYTLYLTSVEREH